MAGPSPLTIVAALSRGLSPAQLAAECRAAAVAAGVLNAFVPPAATPPHLARATATTATALRGVPVAVKANICVAGQPATAASRALAGESRSYGFI